VVRALQREHERRRGWSWTAPRWAGRLAAAEAAPSGAEPGGAAPAPDPLAPLLADLRRATTRYATALRAAGVRPEQMLVRVKAFVRATTTAEGWHDPAAVAALTAHVVRWSIAAYYGR
jgi:hypothetical protein